MTRFLIFAPLGVEVVDGSVVLCLVFLVLMGESLNGSKRSFLH
jgi:hypothetical protein